MNKLNFDRFRSEECHHFFESSDSVFYYENSNIFRALFGVASMVNGTD